MLIMSLLFVILCLGIYVIVQDNQVIRTNRQIATMLPEVIAPSPVRRAARRTQHAGGRLRYYLRVLLNYETTASNQVLVFGCGLLAVIVAALVNQLLLPNWLAPISGLVAGLLVVRGMFGSQRERYADQLLRQLPDTLVLVISSVRAGLPVGEAFRVINQDMPQPTREQFTAVVEAMSLGRTADDALLDVYHRTKVAEYAMFSITLAVQGKAGGRLAETLETLSETVRQRVALAGRAKALAGEAKLSARVLSALPFVCGIIMFFMRRSSIDILLYDPRGKLMLGLGLVSMALGIWMMKHMIKKGTTV
jgi:tight adherence protein B